jgi:hypothetical protein
MRTCDKENIMRIAKSHLAWVMPVLALAVTLYLVGRVVDVLLMILVGAALVGMYFLRRYARAELLYRRLADGRTQYSLAPLPVNRKGTSDRAGT